jgi:spore coat protein CotH
LVTPSPTPDEEPTPDPERPDIVVEHVPIDELGPDGEAFFPLDRFVQIDIELPEASWNSLIDAPYEFTLGHVTLDGRRIENIGVRLRGRIGSFREVWQKPKWRLDFNRYVLGRRVDGLEGLSLDNNVVDCSGLKQALGFYVLGLADVHGSRAGFAEVTVNGVPYGVYNTIELQDDRFLKSRFEDGSGSLYDGAYVWYQDRNYVLLDFNTEVQDLYELEEGVDVDHADIRGVTATLAQAIQGDFVATMDTVWDMDTFYMYAAAEHWIGQNDGYILNTNNNRIYFDPLDGRGTFISYDLDYAFMPQPWGNRSFNNPRGAFAQACVDDAECRQGIADAMVELLDLLADSDLDEAFDDWDVVTRIAAREDPNSDCSSNRITNLRTALRNWIRDRGGSMRSFWGIP